MNVCTNKYTNTIRKTKLFSKYFQIIFEHPSNYCMATQQLTLLQKVVNKLRSEGKIKNDKDFAKKTGYSTGTVSPYLKGKIEPSYAFLKKVEEVFKINLNDSNFSGLEEPEAGYLPKAPPAGQDDQVQKYIRLLEKENQRLESEKVDLKLALDRQVEMYGLLKAVAHHLVKLRVKAERLNEDQLRLETNNIVAVFLREADKAGMPKEVGNGHKKT